MNIVEKARIFATQKHGEIDHRRKYTNEPYINHPAAVVDILRSINHSDTMLAVAWLHDTVEDTNTTYTEILNNFGVEVLAGVDWLTDKYADPKLGNREIRKFLERQRFFNAPTWVKTVKLADLIDNSRSILQHDKGFAATYLVEKQNLLNALTNGDDFLFETASNIVRDALKEIGLNSAT